MLVVVAARSKLPALFPAVVDGTLDTTVLLSLAALLPMVLPGTLMLVAVAQVGMLAVVLSIVAVIPATPMVATSDYTVPRSTHDRYPFWRICDRASVYRCLLARYFFAALPTCVSFRSPPQLTLPECWRQTSASAASTTSSRST